MFSAVARAFGQLFSRAILGLLLTSLALSLFSLLLTWLLVGWLLTRTALFETGWLEITSDVLGGALTLVLSWLLFPLLATLFLGFLLDPTARAVERRYYPHLAPATGLPLPSALLASMKYLALVLAINLLLLPLLLIAPVYPFAFVLGNGLLLGREYSDLVAHRRLSAPLAQSLRRKHSGEIFVLGVLVALLNLVPLLNFLAPVLATMVFVHRFQAWNRP